MIRLELEYYYLSININKNQYYIDHVPFPDGYQLTLPGYFRLQHDHLLGESKATDGGETVCRTKPFKNTHRSEFLIVGIINPGIIRS